MSRLFWIVGWFAVALWSLLAFGAYGLLDLFGGALARHADALGGDPETVEWLFRIVVGLKNLGLAAILVAWTVGSLCLLAVPWLLDRLIGRVPSPAPPRRAGVVDLMPDQYRRVDAGPGPPSGPVPRIDRRP